MYGDEMSAATDLINLVFSKTDYYVGVRENQYQPACFGEKPHSDIVILVDVSKLTPDTTRVIDEITGQLYRALEWRYETMCISYRDERPPNPASQP